MWFPYATGWRCGKKGRLHSGCELQEDRAGSFPSAKQGVMLKFECADPTEHQDVVATIAGGDPADWVRGIDL